MRGFGFTSALLAVSASLAGVGRAFDEAIPQPAPKYKRQPGAGHERAQARLRAKLEANKAIPDAEIVTRQRVRAGQRSQAKGERSHYKQAAMQARLPGGAAAV